MRGRLGLLGAGRGTEGGGGMSGHSRNSGSETQPKGRPDTDGVLESQAIKHLGNEAVRGAGREQSAGEVAAGRK